MKDNIINNNQNKKFKFYSYRYFLIPTTTQVSFENKKILDHDRKEIMREILRNRISHDIKIDQSYIKMYLYKEINENTFICKLAKRKQITTFKDSGNDFEPIKEPSYPFVYIIISLSHQIFLIQEDSSLFKDKEDSSKKLYEYLKRLNDSSYAITIDEITSEASFWDIVENEKIYKLNLNIKSPNLFGGNTKAEELAREMKETTNATETNIEIINQDGNLKLEKKSFSSFLKYIASGGGRWSLNTENGTKKSNTNIGKKININNIESLNNEELEITINNAMSKVDIRPGDDNCEFKENNSK